MTKFFLIFLKKSDFFTCRFVLLTLRFANLCGLFVAFLLIMIACFDKKVVNGQRTDTESSANGCAGEVDAGTTGMAASGPRCGHIANKNLI